MQERRVVVFTSPIIHAVALGAKEGTLRMGVSDLYH
jgi:hypothetical protein